MTNDEELGEFVYNYLGIRLSPVACCSHHYAPLTAFADAYFARYPVVVWEACVPGDALVYTEHGPKMVTALSTGERVWGIKDGATSLGTVSRIWGSGHDHILNIATRSGTLRCNAHHRVLVRRKFSAPRAGQGGYRAVEWRDVYISAEEVTSDDYLVQAFEHALPDDTPDQDAIELAEICGMMIGDGTVDRTAILIAHKEDASYAGHYVDAACRRWNATSTYMRHNRCAKIYSTRVARELEALGVKGHARTKRIPSWIWESGKEVRLAFLRGYLDADGTVKETGETCFYSSNRMLIEDARLLLLSVGIPCGDTRIRHMAGETVIGGRVVTRGDIYEVRAYNPARNCLIGSHTPHYVDRWAKAVNAAIEPPSLFGDEWRGRGKPGYRPGDFLMASGVRYQRVISVTVSDDTVPVYDLTVDGTDTFVSDTFITHNSRGFGGKSLMLAALAMSYAVLQGASVNVLGGSGEQSQRIVGYLNGEDANIPDTFISHPNFPAQLLAQSPQRYILSFRNRGRIKALMASSRSVRGPHPQKLLLDEADECDIEIFEAALGQPMPARGIMDTVVLSSTHQYTNGTMTEIKRRGAENGWAYRPWCYKENLEVRGGWLKTLTVENKRKVVSVSTWTTEYDLQEPNPQDRAIAPDKVDACFDTALGHVTGLGNFYQQFEKPEAYARYITGADWGKETHQTCIWTWRVDVKPMRLVCIRVCQRIAWPVVTGYFDDQVRTYGGKSIHDATGLGDVIDDYMEANARGVILQGKRRYEILSGLVVAIENERVKMPMIDSVYRTFKFLSNDDLYGAGHLPDTFCAAALGHALSRRQGWARGAGT